jgi:hypothetical protein
LVVAVVDLIPSSSTNTVSCGLWCDTQARELRRIIVRIVTDDGDSLIVGGPPVSQEHAINPDD